MTERLLTQFVIGLGILGATIGGNFVLARSDAKKAAAAIPAAPAPQPVQQPQEAQPAQVVEAEVVSEGKIVTNQPAPQPVPIQQPVQQPQQQIVYVDANGVPMNPQPQTVQFVAPMSNPKYPTLNQQ